MKTSTNILIGIDDTDNKESRGTGFRAREMADLLMNDAIGTVIGISRHQLFVHPEIPYTSQNSSACLEVETSQENNLVAFCRDYLLRTCAEGSDAGLCVARADRVSEPVLLWGYSAKTEVLAMNRAEQIAYSNGIILEGLTGEKIGIIGALAAVGLRKSGNDGRFIWLSEKIFVNLMVFFPQMNYIAPVLLM
ncbi:MAG: hypothetical protein KJ607_04380 [Bacteroidetes bacterium]|nr:hypothetical protein [Bacteroidota bacterium]